MSYNRMVQVGILILSLCTLEVFSQSTISPESSPCLPNKNFGKNLTTTEAHLIDSVFNMPSPFSFGGMIGVNDGGLIFRSFQNSLFNPIKQLTVNLRNFHTMDQDFNTVMQGYELNIKPKNTTPEGVPSNCAYNKYFYDKYRNTHGFTGMVAALELLEYSPQSWKDKMFRESDWSVSGPAGIEASFRNYTETFINQFSPPGGTPSQQLVTHFQIGNELWDYPYATDYHAMLAGAHAAFEQLYGPKSAGGWRMRMVASAFQAYRDNNCWESARDVSNCSWSLYRHDFIGDYLNVADCNILRDLDVLDCHPYSFKPYTTTWTYPEDPTSETWQIRNLAGWWYMNRNSATGVLDQARLWSSEFGFDSHPVTGVGEQTQSAYLLRGLLMHSRYHFERVFFYNAYDNVHENHTYYSGLYNSAGLWKMGVHPMNAQWSSPFPEHGATPKPAWYGLLDFKSKFGDHVFFKALREDTEMVVYLIARPNGTDPYLVFWAPRSADDSNVNSNIPVSQVVTWSTELTGSYKVGSNNAQVFASGTSPGETFLAATDGTCGRVTLANVRRMPAFIPLVACSSCSSVTNAGAVMAPVIASGNAPFDPGLIVSIANATGGSASGGTVVYQWQQSTDNVTFTNITGATGLGYNPPALSQTTWFRRGARRSLCTDWLYTSPVKITVYANDGCAQVSAFKRRPHTNSSCNVSDRYYEVVLQNITSAEQIDITGLPGNGVNVTMSSLNGVPFSTGTFNSTLQYLSQTSFRWVVNPANGATQTVRIYFCWANTYPEPASVTQAKVLCSGVVTTCVATENGQEEGSDDRGYLVPASLPELVLFPNPGTDFFQWYHTGNLLTQARLRVTSVTGGVVWEETYSEIQPETSQQVPVATLPAGIYRVSLVTSDGIKSKLWQKQ